VLVLQPQLRFPFGLPLNLPLNLSLDLPLGLLARPPARS
jgi:hypothetical protein